MLGLNPWFMLGIIAVIVIGSALLAALFVRTDNDPPDA